MKFGCFEAHSKRLSAEVSSPWRRKVSKSCFEVKSVERVEREADLGMKEMKFGGFVGRENDWCFTVGG